METAVVITAITLQFTISFAVFCLYPNKVSLAHWEKTITNNQYVIYTVSIYSIHYILYILTYQCSINYKLKMDNNLVTFCA